MPETTIEPDGLLQRLGVVENRQADRQVITHGRQTFLNLQVLGIQLGVAERHIVADAHQHAERFQVTGIAGPLFGPVEQNLQQRHLVVVGLTIGVLPGLNRADPGDQADRQCYQPWHRAYTAAVQPAEARGDGLGRQQIWDNPSRSV